MKRKAGEREKLMLIAKNKYGDWVNIIHLQDKIMLKMYRQQHTFYCPECNEELTLKIGQIKIPHFAHRKNSNCLESYERETEYHLSGKMQLYAWLEKQNLYPELEKYYPSIRQRADIALRFQDAEYAIEFQCSSIPEEVFLRRTMNYRKAGITPIWINGAVNLNRKSSFFYSLTSFDYLMLRKTSAGLSFIPFYCSTEKRFILIHQIHPISARKAAAVSSISYPDKCNFSDLLTFDSADRMQRHMWKTEMRRQKNYAFINRGLFPHKFIYELYRSHLNVPSLPPEIGLPLHYAAHIMTSPIQWQMYLFLDVIQKRQEFSNNELLKAFDRRLKHRDIILRILPHLEQDGWKKAVLEYADVLEKLYVLSSPKHNYYKVERKLNFSMSQEELLKADDDLYRRFGKFLFNRSAVSFLS